MQPAYLLVVELISMASVAILFRKEASVLWPTIAAILFLAAAQAVFWVYTFPANIATENWTVVPDQWESLRSQWEYSHAVGASFQVLAMSALIIGVLARTRPSGSPRTA